MKSQMLTKETAEQLIAKVNEHFRSQRLPQKVLIVLCDHSDSYGECVSIFEYDENSGNYIYQSSGTFWDEFDNLRYSDSIDNQWSTMFERNYGGLK